MDIETFNGLGRVEAADLMQGCCTASRWIERMVEGRPYSGADEMLARAEQHWSGMVEADWLEAFEGHPRIGNPESLQKKYRATLATASMEQSSVRGTDEEILVGLAEGNQAYFKRFGFIFIIFASGRSARDMLEQLRARLGNSRRTELVNAAAEQWKITRRRLEEAFAVTHSHAA